MRRILALILVVLFLVMSVDVFAQSYKYIYNYHIINETTARQITIIGTTSIRPNIDKVIGWDIRPYDGAKSSVLTIGIFDGTTNALDGECLQESEARSNAGDEALWVHPKRITEGVVVDQGVNTEVNIYFIRE